MEYLTKYEASRIIGLRALEIQNGAPHLVDIDDGKLRMDNIYVAALELKLGVLDFKINRFYPMDNIHQVHSVNYRLPPDVDVLLHTKKGTVRSSIK
jgi:DNA-directed RNA polymerase subunit K/omega